MAAPELFAKVGFERTKFGADGKQSGYKIKESSLTGLLGSIVIAIVIMGIMVVMMVYDVRFEKKTVMRNMRVEEHHAVKKLAQVQMELWEEFHEDIQESTEATTLLTNMNNTFVDLEAKIKSFVDDLSKEFSISAVKAHTFSDKLLHVVVAAHKDNVDHFKKLVDHLVMNSKKSKQLQKKVEQDVRQETRAELKREAEDKQKGLDVMDHHKNSMMEEPTKHGKHMTKKEEVENQFGNLDPLLRGIFNEFNKFDKRYTKENELAIRNNGLEERLEELLSAVDTGSIAVGEDCKALHSLRLYKKGFTLPNKLEGYEKLNCAEIIEEIALLPKISHKFFRDAEKRWRSGTEDDITIFSEIEKYMGVFPGQWMQKGVTREEEAEERARPVQEDNSPKQKARAAPDAGDHNKPHQPTMDEYAAEEPRHHDGSSADENVDNGNGRRAEEVHHKKHRQASDEEARYREDEDYEREMAQHRQDYQESD